MTDNIQQACSDLTAWLPIASDLIAQPDTDNTSSSHTKPGSRPPWNAGPAYAVTDIHAGARTIENELRYDVTGTHLHRGGSDRNTIRALEAIPALAEAADQHTVTWATRELARMLTNVLQLPAIDHEEPPRRINAPCPYCQRNMLRVWPRAGKLTCLALGCTDTNGEHPFGHMTIGQVSGEPYIAWADGTIQIPPPETDQP